ncbi:hypothetical protein HYN48_13685 [Flavobacterium magnum]|uniref:Uncharacterized protein n=1 Tax=Flavobacterium magnum TaxID=2162713 RepID=A0A2S0RIF5_9FLAO|nr:hypothetical protein HYN48_13685 [Flavobacterium magnum]
MNFFIFIIIKFFFKTARVFIANFFWPIIIMRAEVFRTVAVGNFEVQFRNSWLIFRITSGGFTSVAAFGTEYSRLDKTKLWKKEVHFTKEVAIA